MQDPAQFRKYAEECRRLAQFGLPEHRVTLLEIAEAWIKCAEDLESMRSSAGTTISSAKE
jgi:hypothetical protein